MTIIAAMKNLTPTASSMGMSNAIIGSSSSGVTMQGSNKSANLLGCLPCLPDLHINADVHINVTVNGCTVVDTCVKANIC
ncbi:hypothetical protein SAMD00019534_064060 [Acytostelium subglobosum LB1]|uniref:hypothetical protein n=1 Tax=Acytostelium subglobosum LB1 TaxID=1410327 RepID=UPI0006448436|nr:hypothetical protein SAMD00019534_064060 [Acytostelium subglobosum LB1]GAM23231.1 hypothetical protein SAMD00019534_064060 [Acytostelium subglobosum LB1]|eukprot:XP_012753680.1 hypothetical protein SAMD00019534_064060 [Acytostelium subglobosum LB1]